MANNEIAIRFTEEMYATKKEVARILNTSLIDNFWDIIAKYRANFARILSLRSIEKDPFSVVLTPSIQEKLTSLERKFARGMIQFSKFSNDQLTLDRILTKKYSEALRYVAEANNVKVTDDVFYKIINSGSAMLFADQKLLINYYDSLLFIKKTYVSPFNEDYLANLYSHISDNQELVKLYRDKESSSPSQRTLINREYDSAPVNMISEMMNNLCNFVTDSNISFVIKAIATIYFVNYVKPFDAYNKEVAILLAKDIIAKNEVDEFAFLLPLESLLIDNVKYKDVIKEVQKTNDLTYFVIYIFDILEEMLDSVLDLFVTSKLNIAQKEHIEKEVEVTDKTVSIFDNVSENKEVPITKVEVKEAPEVSAPTSVQTEVPQIKRSFTELQFVAIDEKEASKIEEHLLEINPRLKRGEAYFFARHCSIGKYYTIAQYKKTLGCAYETARTSMEQLVSEGYYRKEQIKNKFIYTPVERK